MLICPLLDTNQFYKFDKARYRAKFKLHCYYCNKLEEVHCSLFILTLIDVNTNTQTQGEDAVLATAHVYGTKLEIIIRSGYN